MKKVSIFLIVVAVFLTAALKSCKDEKEKDVPVSGVSFKKDKETLTVNSGLTLLYDVRPENATNKGVTFSSSKTEIATVDAGGNVSAKAVGTTEITITTVEGGKKDYCTITVIKADVPVTGVVLAPAALTLTKVGEEYDLIASVVPANADNKLVEWKSDKPAVATVVDGKVTALTSGTANIEVKSSEGAFTQTCVVTVDILVTGVTISRGSLSLLLKDPEPEFDNLSAFVLPAEALVRDVSWKIEPATGVATMVVNEDGTVTVTAAGVGTAVITVTTAQGDFSATCNVTVDLPPDKIVGADFSQAIVYNFSGDNKFPEAYNTVNDSRYAYMDLEHVFVTGRFDNQVKPFLLRLEDLKNEIIAPVFLDNLPEAGSYGYFPWASGQMAHGHIYSNSLVLAGNAGLNVHHWEKTAPDAEPTNITEGMLTDIENGIRLGDMMTVDINETGNGYLFLKRNAHQDVLRITVNNFTQASNPIFITPHDIDSGPFATFYKVDGSEDEYMYTGAWGPIKLVKADGTTLYQLTSLSERNTGCGARIVNFNEARYLITVNNTTVDAVISVYDITKGGTTVAALETFDAGSVEPVYTFSLGKAMPSDNLGISVDCAKDGDNKMYIIASGTTAGFAIIELLAVEEE